MRKPLKITIIVVASIIVLAAIIYIIPAPFKPSLWRTLNEQKIQSQLDKSTDPVYLPRSNTTATYAGITYHSRFTMYSTWQDAYYIQSIYQGYYYQLSPRSVVELDDTGPEPPVTHFLRDIKDKKVCDVKDKQITDCSFFQQGLGERKYKIYGIDGYTFVAEVTQIQYGSTKDKLRDFNSDEVKAIEKMLTDTAPVPLAEARKSRFEYNI